MSTRPRSQAGPPMTLGNMGANGVVARRVLLAVPPPGYPERGPLARSRAGAIVRSAHGVHSMRYHRCRRPAELAGTATAREPDRGAMAVSPQCGFAAKQRRALRLLAGAPLGATEAIMLAHGFTNAMLDALVRDGLATAERRAMKAGRQPITVTWFTTTDARRLALSACDI
jgi:hypothetical protein